MIDSPTSKYVLAFAELMEYKLSKNRHKGDREGWRNLSYAQLLKFLHQEVTELDNVISNDLSPWPEFQRKVKLEAADVANFAMMIADRVGDEVSAVEGKA